jgi:hypothetical protein
VLVLAEPVEEPVTQVVVDAARYHGAQLVVLVESGQPPPVVLGEDATVLERPQSDEGAFAALVGRYAVALAEGTEPAQAWQSAVRGAGWEPVDVPASE